MSATRAHRDYLYYLIYGSGYIDSPWSHIWGRDDYANDHWQLFVRPTPRASNVGLVDMSNEDAPEISIVKTKTYAYNVLGNLVYAEDAGVPDMRTADRLSLDHHDVGPEAAYKLALQDVEFVDAPVDQETHLEIITKHGFTTDGTLASITMNVGHQEMVFTGAARDSTIFMGPGYDKIDFADHLDVPGQQYWSVIRRPDGELDVYSLFSGYRVQLGGGYKGWTANASSIVNYGEIEEITIKDARTGGTVTYLPGVDLPYDPNGLNNRGTATNIDLRGDGQLFSDSFNLAYFNFIRYTSDNVWAGEATIHNGTLYSTPSDRTVTTTKYGVDAPILSGTMSVVGQSRNGTHDLIVAEQEAGKAIDGYLRLYAFDVDSGLYNQFNQVFLGTADPESSNKSTITGTEAKHRVALYGFGGNDVLTGGAGRDYLFGGQSSYNQLVSGAVGNIVTGGAGADYFGVGNTDAAGALSGGTSVLASGLGDFRSGFATDVIMDWDAGKDTLVVLPNGVAVIGGLYGITGMAGNNTIDLRATAAFATSDQDFDGARGGADVDLTPPGTSTAEDWDATKSLDFIHANQGIRDANSIRNEADVTVVNNGLIVTRGLGGNDMVWGSVGADYIYGGDGKNYLNLGVDTAQDRAFVDQFVGMQVVRQFDNGEDKIYLNIDAIYDAHDRIDNTLSSLNPHGGLTSRDPYSDEPSQWVNNSTPTLFTDGRSSAFGLDLGALDIIYVPWSETYLAQLNTGTALYSKSNGAWRNVSHNAADGLADIALGVAGGAAITIGTGMLFSPFTAAAGVALIATGASQVAAVMTSEPHLNAEYHTPYHIGEYYVNYLTAAKAVTTQFNTDNTPLFTDFFWNAGVNTTFAKAVEFINTRDGGPVNSGITTYAVLKSDKETFIYYVQSEDNIITDDEARLVAEIESLVPVTDLVGYKGDLDIYNQGDVALPIYPKAATLVVEVDGTVTSSGRMKDSSIVLTATLQSAPKDGDKIAFYNGNTLLSEVAATTSQTVYTHTHSVTVSAGKDTVLDYRVVTKSSQGFTSSSNTVTRIYDDMAPAFTNVTAVDLGGASGQIKAAVTGSGVSSTEKFEVKLVDPVNSSVVGEVQYLTSSDSEATLSVGEQTAAITLDLRATDAVGNTTSYKLGGTPNVVYLGTSSSDTYNNLSGTTGQLVFTFRGNDSISAGSGSDVIVAGDGDDSINGGAGADILVGGAGADVFYFSSPSDFLSDGKLVDVLIDGGSGVDRISIAGGVDISNTTLWTTTNTTTVDLPAPQPDVTVSSTTGVSSVEELHITGNALSVIRLDVTAQSVGIRTIDITGSKQSGNIVDVSEFTAGVVIRGASDATSTLIGGTGNDTITGGSGNDMITGGGGLDTIYGESGNDDIRWENGAGSGITVYGGNGNDVIDANAGDVGNDLIFGDDGDDQIWGGGGDDTIYAGAGNDTIMGEAGADVIVLTSDTTTQDRIVYSFNGNTFSSDGPLPGSDTGYDIISNFDFGSSDKVDVSGFVLGSGRKLDGTATSSQSSSGGNVVISDDAGMLIVTSSSIGTTGLTNSIATALDAAFDLSKLSNTEDIFFAVKADNIDGDSNTDQFWFGVYRNAGTDDDIASTDIQVLALIGSSSGNTGVFDYDNILFAPPPS